MIPSVRLMMFLLISYFYVQFVGGVRDWFILIRNDIAVFNQLY
jgi:hypothetical protein